MLLPTSGEVSRVQGQLTDRFALDFTSPHSQRGRETGAES